jgi:hypothetical protein
MKMLFRQVARMPWLKALLTHAKCHARAHETQNGRLAYDTARAPEASRYLACSLTK